MAKKIHKNGYTSSGPLLTISLPSCIGVGRGGRAPPWIFIHDADKVEGGLTVLFFGLVLSVVPPENLSADALAFVPLLLNYAHTPYNFRSKLQQQHRRKKH